ncbi:hypothetical protein [Paenibacillus sp. P32E]|uniref:hypothetical protein n=1 Tax=Paenibacillus sp. P32E TaxID=1349434 RepID=UPI000939202D|nr:hypothetical protein [Paenibacillus sp. P32E]OKP82518.1 hypothetical protein A3848_28245 [Paenibacillus sp. P32E]
MLAEELKAYLQFLKTGSAGRLEVRTPEEIALRTDIVHSEADLSKGASARFKAFLRFEENCQLENIRAFTVIHQLGETMDCSFTYLPEDIIENPDSAEVIRRDGFVIVLETQECGEAVAAFLRNAPYVSEMAMEQLETENTAAVLPALHGAPETAPQTIELSAPEQKLPFVPAREKKPKEGGPPEGGRSV